MINVDGEWWPTSEELNEMRISNDPDYRRMAEKIKYRGLPCGADYERIYKSMEIILNQDDDEDDDEDPKIEPRMWF